MSSEFLVWTFCGIYNKIQFPHSFGRFARNCAETVPFHKISTAGKLGKIKVKDSVKDSDILMLNPKTKL